MQKFATNCSLSSLVIDGLKCLNCSLPEEILRKILTYCVRAVINPNEVVPILPETYAHSLKNLSHVKYAVASLYIIAAQYNLEGAQFKELIECVQLSSSVVDDLFEIYNHYRKQCAIFHTQLGASLNRMDEIDWRISVDMNSSTSEMIPELNFHIVMYHYNSNTGDKDIIVKFACNTEEMQLLIHKLKSLERHCNKFITE